MRHLVRLLNGLRFSTRLDETRSLISRGVFLLAVTGRPLNVFHRVCDRLKSKVSHRDLSVSSIAAQ